MIEWNFNEFDKKGMTKMKAVTKGAMVGVATGCLTAAAIVKGSNMKKHHKKKAERAAKSIGSAIQDIVGMVK